MATQLPRLSITMKTEWDEDLDNLKRTEFYDRPKADMLRYLIELGLENWRSQHVNKKAEEQKGA